jgi:hypothetical protein
MATREKPRPVDALRAFGVMLGGSAALAAAAGASVASSVRAVASGRRPRPFALAGLLGLGVYVAIGRPWLLRWGASEDEVCKPLACDELVPEAGMQTTRAVTIDVPIKDVWPWIAQMGQDRAGFYSYEWLENLAGCRMKNADRIERQWQERSVGETVRLHWAHGLKLARFDPPTTYCFEGGWHLALESHDERTRLIARGRFPRGAFALAYTVLLELPHFIMERRMLLGIKERAEQAHFADNPVARDG